MRFVALSIFWLLVGCSGLRGRADALLEKGAYREAVQTYEAVLQRDPRDERALAGLKNARTGFIDKKLIEVRMARMAGNDQLALDMLLELVQLQSQWDFFPPGPLANTQAEESAEALRFVESRIGSTGSSAKPLAGLYLLTRYQPIFAGTLAGRREFLLRELGKAGKSQCNALSTNESAKHPYFSQFVRKVCTAWGIVDRGTNVGLSAKRAGLYGSVRVALNVEGLPRAYRAAVENSLEEGFRASPWFDAKSRRTLPVSLSGNFRHDHQRFAEQRVHGYTVQESYTDYQAVSKNRQIPYTDYQENCHWDHVTNQRVCNRMPVTKYHNESYTEQEPVTRYRDIPRFQNYDGWSHKQQLELRLQGELKLASLSRPLRLDVELQREGFEHHWNLPHIGLVPQKPNLENPENWTKTQAQILATELESVSGEIWDQLFCEPMTAEPTLVATGDLVHRCLRHRRQTPPGFADAWYQKFFGLTVAQADELLHLADL